MKYQARNNLLINWSEYPMLRMTLCFILGIGVSDLFRMSLEWSTAVAVGGILILGMLIRIENPSISIIRMTSMILLLMGIVLGIWRGNLAQGQNDRFHFTKYIEDDHALLVQVDSEMKRKKRNSVQASVVAVNERPTRGKLLVYFSHQDSTSYRIGDILTLQSKIYPLTESTNPKAFSYKSYLYYQGITHQTFLREGDYQLWTNQSNIITKSTSNLRRWALSIFEERLKDHDQFATASAMVLGYRQHISDALYTSFSDTGAVHVLAVSGLHVGIICMIFLLLFSRIRNESNGFKIIKLLTLLTVVWIYALVAGASPAVLRAAVMFSFLLVGRLWFAGANIYNILASSAFVLLMYDPFLLFQLSFQFSYLALISIVFFQPKIEQLYDTKNGITTRIWQLTTVSIAAQVLIFPISVYHFHSFPTYFILSGIVAVFLATFILGLGILVLCVHTVPVLGDGASGLYQFLLDIFLKSIRIIQELPYNKVDGVYISVGSVLLLYAGILLVMYLISIRPNSYKDVLYKKVKRKRLAKMLIATCVLGLLGNHVRYEFRTLHDRQMVVYDVRKSTLIDLFLGNARLTLALENLDEQQEDYASKSFRIYKGSPVRQSFDWMQHSILRFKERDILFANRVEIGTEVPCHSDILLVVNDAQVDPALLLGSHHTDLVVVDNSINYKQRKHWIDLCKQKDIPIHLVAQHGVFTL